MKRETERKRQTGDHLYVSSARCYQRLCVKANGKCQHTHYIREILHNKPAWSTKGRLLASEYVAISSLIDPQLRA